MNRSWALLVVGVCLACISGGARGAFIYNYGLDLPGYQVQIDPGQTVSVLVYIQETMTAPDTTSKIEAELGLGTAGVRVERTSVGALDPVLLTGVTPSAEFDPSFTVLDLAADKATLYEMVDVMLGTAGVPAADLGSGIRRVYLGSFQFTAGTTVGEQTVFEVGKRGLADDTSTFGNPVPTTLDGDPPSPGISSTSVTFQVTPEPATLAILMLGLATIVRRRRR